jgi:hypothetical protein
MSIATKRGDGGQTGLQRELFRVGSGLATPPESRNPQVPVTEEMVEALTRQVQEIEATEGLLSDRSLPGEHPACGQAHRVGGGGRAEYSGVSQPAPRLAVAFCEEDRSGCRCRKLPARDKRHDRAQMVESLVVHGSHR